MSKNNSEKMYSMNMYDLLCNINNEIINDNKKCILKIIMKNDKYECLDNNHDCNKCIQLWLNKIE